MSLWKKLCAGMAIIIGIAAAGSPAVAAQDADLVSCGIFDTQESAQDALDALSDGDPGRDSLDSDGDGQACEDASHLVECSEFASLADAESFVDRWAAGTEFANLEDEDGDGVYCEAYFGVAVDQDAGIEDAEDGGTPTTQDSSLNSLPSTGSGPSSSMEHPGLLAAIAMGLAVFGQALRTQRA